MGTPRSPARAFRRRRARPALACFVLVAVCTGAAAGELDLTHTLEGKRFVGPLGPEGGSEPDEEMLVFHEGILTSKICVQYGFEPAPYWVREDEQGLHFYAELDSEDNGTAWFEGVFDGEEIQATVTWEKERWYWTVEQTLVFTGRPAVEAQ